MKNSDCLKTSISVMSLTGVWRRSHYIEDPRNIYFFIYFYCCQSLIFFSVVLAEISYVVSVYGNTELMVEAGVLLLSHLVQVVKTFTIWARQHRIKRLIQMIDEPAFTRTDPAKRNMLSSTTRLATLCSNWVFMPASGVTALCWCIVPFLQDKLTFPLKTFYPFDTDASPTFQIMFVYLSASVILVGLTDAAENFLVSGLFLLAAAQLDVLSYELAERRDQEASNSSQNDYDRVVSCVKYHQQIIEFVNEVAGIFGLPIFCQFVITSIVVCMTVFKVTLSTEPLEITTMVFYLICVFMEILMYCYPGDVLLNKSLQISDAAYTGFRGACDRDTGRALLLISLRAQRPLGVCAGGLFTASLPTSAAIVQTSYSYYAMLKQTQNN